MPVLGIDIGGSGIKANVVDLDLGEPVGKRLKVATPQPSTPEAVAGAVADLVKRFDVDGPIGCTFPAVVLDGVTMTAANVDESWIGTDAAALFREALGRPVTVVNDADAAGLAARLRAASNVDAVAAAVRVPIRYRRTRAALARLRARAAGTADERLAAFLTGDEVVAAVAAEAAAVLAQHGLEPRPDPVHWRRYGRGPVGALHRACAADLCRAALRAVRR